MSAARSIAAMARADFLERTRRYSFFLALLFAVFLGYATATGTMFLQFDEYRGVLTSAWIGALVALTITCFVSLVGFYIVKNSVERDRDTGVGQILAATPLSKTAYAFGKLLSNFAVLSAMVGVLAVAAVVMQFIAAEDPAVDLVALLSPFVLIAMPMMAFTAAVALFFEVMPGLRGGFGNVAWFFVWVSGIIVPMETKRWLDPMGFALMMDAMAAGARRYVPNYHGGESFQIDPGHHAQVIQAWHWTGVAWDARLVGLRLMWFGVACALALVAAAVFDRFDTAKVEGGKKKSKKGAGVNTVKGIMGGAAGIAEPVHLTPLAVPARVNAFGRLCAAELRLALFGMRWWWYVVAAGLLIAQFAAPLEVSRGPLVASAWMWCVFVWSGMGAREKRFNTRGLLFSCANILPRQLLACWAAGVAVSMAMGAGAAARLLIAADTAGLLAWLAGALVLPSSALFLGVLSGTSKPFEGALTLVWYVGPMNHTPGFDYTGAANGAHTTAYAMITIGIAAACVVGACVVRARQLRGV